MALTLWGKATTIRPCARWPRSCRSRSRTSRHLRSDDHWRSSPPGDGRARPHGACRAQSPSARRPGGADARECPRRGRGRGGIEPVDAHRGWRMARTRADLKALVVGNAGGPVRLADIATVEDEAGEPTDYVFYHPARGQAYPAVTLSIAKRSGTNAIDLTRAVEQKVETLRGYLRARGSAADRHAQLRRNRRAQVQRAALAHVHRRHLGVDPHLVRARPSRVARGAHRDSRDAGADAVRLLSLRLHAQPHHAVRADLLHRHPGGRRHRGGGEHRAARAAGRRPAVDWRTIAVARGGRSRQPHHPRHADGRGAPSSRWPSSAG